MIGPRQGGHWVDGMAKKVGFVAAGTGITPTMNALEEILRGLGYPEESVILP
ncbi:MAG TPA: hypothetical protein VF205_04210 [Nitrospiraceae bacterium]